MGKFGCRLYCWGCGGCCIITGVVMGILAGLIPPGMVSSLQESLFDLSYIDDTSQSEAEGLLADAGLPVAESDAFKAWGKAFSDGFKDCKKADFAFDWSKRPEDCVDGLHPTFFILNATNTESWGDHDGKGFNVLQVQEVGGLTALKDAQKVEPNKAYWDETGKARFRQLDHYHNSNKCSDTCDEFSRSAVVSPNFWYGVMSIMQIADGWTLSAAAATLPRGGHPATLKAYLEATDGDKASERMGDFNTFLGTDEAPTLGNINLVAGQYTNLRRYLWDMGGTLITQMAPTYGVAASVTPIFTKTTPNAVLGWSEAHAYQDHISAQWWTYNFLGEFSGREVYWDGSGPDAYMEAQMSSAFYHEGLGYSTQHYETFNGGATNTHSCNWDPDCAGQICTVEGTSNCLPITATGYDGGKIPGLYFFSPKGSPSPGFTTFTHFVQTYYLVITMQNTGRAFIPAEVQGPDAQKEGNFDFRGMLVHVTFKAASYYRRLENCYYAGGRDLGGGIKDSPGLDCNWVKDSSPIGPYFGIPLYWLLLPRNFIPVGWDPVQTNAGDGDRSTTLSQHMIATSCFGNKFCSDTLVHAKGAAFPNFLHYGYEPHLGALVDVSLVGALGWKFMQKAYGRHASRHEQLTNGAVMLPLFWVWNYLHLPGAINMDLAKLQAVPAALNGFYIFFIVQCMVSLIGGVACCFCGV